MPGKQIERISQLKDKPAWLADTGKKSWFTELLTLCFLVTVIWLV